MGKDPIAAFISKVAGLDVTRQRGCTAMQMWSSESFAAVKEEFDMDIAHSGGGGRKGRIAQVGKFTTERWKALTDDQQKYWEDRAAQDAKDVAQSKEDTKRPLERLSPEDTQRYVFGISFLIDLADIMLSELSTPSPARCNPSSKDFRRYWAGTCRSLGLGQSRVKEAKLTSFRMSFFTSDATLRG